MNPEKVAMVTGPAQGIGRAIAERLLQAGWSLVAVDRQAEGCVGQAAGGEGSQNAVGTAGGRRRRDGGSGHGAIRRRDLSRPQAHHAAFADAARGLQRGPRQGHLGT